MRFSLNRACRAIGYLVTIFLVSFSFAGCVGNTYRLAQVDYDHSKYESLGIAKGYAGGAMIYPWFIPAAVNSTIERASRDAIKQRGGDDIVNVTVQQKWWWALVFQLFRVSVEGEVIKAKPVAMIEKTPEVARKAGSQGGACSVEKVLKLKTLGLSDSQIKAACK